MTARAGQFVRLLGSDRDGEALNAVRALGRLLESHGRDFHWVADLVDRHLPAPSQARPPWQITAEDLLRRGGGGLTAAEINFLLSMAHWKGEPSERQWRWLNAIATALKARAA